MRLRALLLSIGFSLIPFALAHAETEETWDVGSPKFSSVQSQQLTTAQMTSEGIQINTTQDGYVVWTNPFSKPVEVGILTVKNQQPIEAMILWHVPGMPENQNAQIFFTIPASTDFQTIPVVLSNYGLWNWHADRIGIGFPAGTNITIKEIAWKHWSIGEKISEGWKSFWIFDSFRKYSINFLWGPLLVFNPYARAHLYDSLPPLGWSVDRFFYVVIALGIVISIIIGFFAQSSDRRRRIILGSTMTIAAVWMVFDLRMGLELLSYAKTDYSSYLSKPLAERNLRSYDILYALGEQMLPTLMKYKEYALFVPEGSAMYSILRYESYPSIPRSPNQDLSSVKLFAIIERSDIGVTSKGQLVNSEGTILHASGSVLQIFDDHSFLYAAQ